MSSAWEPAYRDSGLCFCFSSKNKIFFSSQNHILFSSLKFFQRYVFAKWVESCSYVFLWWCGGEPIGFCFIIMTALLFPNAQALSRMFPAGDTLPSLRLILRLPQWQASETKYSHWECGVDVACTLDPLLQKLLCADGIRYLSSFSSESCIFTCKHLFLRLRCCEGVFSWLQIDVKLRVLVLEGT